MHLQAYLLSTLKESWESLDPKLAVKIHYYFFFYNTLEKSDRLIGCMIRHFISQVGDSFRRQIPQDRPMFC